MRFASWVLLTAILVLAPAGGGRAGAHPSSDGSTSEAGFDNVDVIDRGLDGKLSVVSVGSDRTNTNLLSIFASLKNLTGHSLAIEAQTLYKDGNGDWLDGGKAGWLPLTLKPHEELEYRSASLSEDAQDFLVRVRRAVNP